MNRGSKTQLQVAGKLNLLAQSWISISKEYNPCISKNLVYEDGDIGDGLIISEVFGLGHQKHCGQLDGSRAEVNMPADTDVEYQCVSWG